MVGTSGNADERLAEVTASPRSLPPCTCGAVGGSALSGRVDEVITAPNLSALYGAPIEVLRTADGRLVVVGQPEAPHHHGDRHEHDHHD